MFVPVADDAAIIKITVFPSSTKHEKRIKSILRTQYTEIEREMMGTKTEECGKRRRRHRRRRNRIRHDEIYALHIHTRTTRLMEKK